MSAARPRSSAKKPLLIGCSVAVLLLLLCGGLATFFGTRGIDIFRAEMERAAEDERFAQEWAPPAEDAAAGSFEPESVAGYDLVSADGEAAFPALGIEKAGRHAVYERGGDTVEVSVYRADETETGAVFDEVVRRIDDDARFKSHSHVRLPRSLRFSVSDPVDLHGVLWHADGWLVFVRSATVADLGPFLREYLAAVAAQAEAESADEAGSQPEPASDGDA